ADEHPADRGTVERSGGDVKIKNLTAFVAVVDAGMHAPRAAQALGVPLASIHSSLEKLEDEVGHPLIGRDVSPWRLTPAGELLLDEARRRIADLPASAPPRTTGGGKAKASKGTGRAPIVKGQPKPYKKRQGR
ncbi:LysR family transcriptional regulator, partial [Microbacterium aurum]|uniref:LysR family transcriptional regulator n=1 Tax=Microbacterium aurum TaxID=36805 RepID=UPI0028F125EB